MNKKGENRKFSSCIFSSRNHRGSNVDVILSFVIFISFMVFFYAIIQPNITIKNDRTEFLNYMGGELIKNLTGNNLTAISIQAEPQNPRDCLKLEGFMDNAGISSMSLILRNLTGTAFSAYKSGDDLYIDMAPDENTEFFNAYYSPGLSLIADNPLGNCNPALREDEPPNSYSIDREETYTSYYIWSGEIVKLIDNYNNDYDAVKEWFNLTSRDNFGFNFTYQNETTIGTNDNAPASVNVYSEAFPAVYISESNLEAGNLIVRIW